MTTFSELKDLHNHLLQTRQVATYLTGQFVRSLHEVNLDELARWVPLPIRTRGAKSDPKIVCVPVERAYTHEGDLELLLLCFEHSGQDVGIVLEDRLHGSGQGVLFKFWSHASLAIASASAIKNTHLAELVRQYKLRGVVAGIQHNEQRGHALAYCDEPALLNLTDIEGDGERCRYYLDEHERNVREVHWSQLPHLVYTNH